MKSQSQTAAILLLAALSSGGAWAWPHKEHGERARVRFLATSTLIHRTWGENEDTYLAQPLLPKQKRTVLVRLVNANATEWPPLARAIFTSDAGALLAVKRDATCDRPFGQMLLRTAPGDPKAILPQPLPAVAGPDARRQELSCCVTGHCDDEWRASNVA